MSPSRGWPGPGGRLALHAEYPKNKAELAAKRGPAPEFPTAREVPACCGASTVRTLDYSGNVVQELHPLPSGGRCSAPMVPRPSRTVPAESALSLPTPKVAWPDPGSERAGVRCACRTGFAGEQSGFRPGRAARLDGQPLLSIADMQWVLHQASPEGASIKADVRRGSRNVQLSLTLAKGWRQRDDISWRASSWGFRRMVTGGMLLVNTPPEQRKTLGLSESAMALSVEHLGEFSPHDIAKRAGFRKGDILTSFDGKTSLTRESDLMAYALTQCQPDARVPVTVLRAGTKLAMDLPMQP